MSDNNNLMLTLLSVSIGVLLINTILLISHMKRDTRERERESRENFKSNMWDNGGVYNGIGTDNNPFQTKLARSCSGYGVQRPLNQDMPFNDDSNLYTFNGNPNMMANPRR